MAKKKLTRKQHASVRVEKFQKNAKPMSAETKKWLLCGAGALVVIAAIYLIFFHGWPLAIDADGNAVTRGDGWVVVNKGTSAKPAVYECAQVAAPEGYALDTEWHIKTKPERDYYFTPTDEAAPITSVYFSGQNRDAKEIIDSFSEQYKSMYSGGEFTQDTRRLAGYECQVVYTEHCDDEGLAEAKRQEALTGEPSMGLYIIQRLGLYAKAKNGTTLIVLIGTSPDSRDDFIPREELYAMAERVMAGVSMK